MIIKRGGGVAPRPRLPVTVVSTVDPVLRELSLMTAVVDRPGVLAVGYDLVAGADGPVVRRRCFDACASVEDVVLDLDHPCVACAVRLDLLPLALRHARARTHEHLLVALPPGTEPLVTARALHTGRVGTVQVRRHLALAGAVTVVRSATTEDDLVGADLLADRGLALGDDHRCVGEAVARQLRCADLVVAVDDAPGQHRAPTVLAHASAATTLTTPSLADLGGDELLAARHEERTCWAWEDPLEVDVTGAPDADGVWTLDLSSPHALHPARLMERLEDLGSGRLVSRGRFWMPTRPGMLGIWDGAGSQLSIGAYGRWPTSRRGTRLVVTGLDEDPERVRSAFAAALTTTAELDAGAAAWGPGPDGFEAWLGEVHETA